MRSMVLLCLVSFLVVGCGRNIGDTAKKDLSAGSAKEFVEKAQSGMPQPSGSKFKPGSAKEMGDGKVVYQDIEGKKWQVTVTKEGADFKSTEPMPVK